MANYQKKYCSVTTTRQSHTNSVRSYNCKPTYQSGSQHLQHATARVLTSNNPRTQATGVALGAFAAVGAVCSVAAIALNIIGGGRR